MTEPTAPVEHDDHDERLDRRLPPVGALVVIAGLLAVGFWISKDLWFIDDDWDFLTQRRMWVLEDHLRPHAGHWTLPLTPLLRGLYATFGMDYFPGWLLPRFIASGLVAVYLWKVLVRRGAAEVVATIAASAFVVLDAAGGHRAVSVGNYVVVAALLYVAQQVADDDPPSRRDLVLVALALLAAVCSFSTGLILVAATGLVVLVTRRLRQWWPALVPALVVYGAWTVAYGPERAGQNSLADLVKLPLAMGAVLANSQASLFGVPTVVGAVIAAVEVVVIARWAWARRLDRFDGVATVMLLGFLAATALERIGDDAGVADTDRYGFVPIVCLALVLVPRIPRPATRPATALTIVAGLALVTVNVLGMNDRANELADAAAERRIRVETAARLLAEGRPAVDDSWVTVPLTVEGLRVLVDDGWRPQPSPTAQELRRSRGVLWIGLGPDSKQDDAVTDDDPGCATAATGDELGYDLDEASVLVASADRPTRVRLRVEIDGVVGERVIAWNANRGAFRGEAGRFGLAAPADGTATVELTVVEATDLVLCEVQPADG